MASASSSVSVPDAPRTLRRTLLRALFRIAIALAAVKSLIALVVLGLMSIERIERVTTFPAWISAIHIIVFGGVGGWLVLGGRRDSRAQWLGGYFLLSAAMFSARAVESWATWAPPAVAAIAAVLAAVRPEAFLAFMLWAFARQFPKGHVFSPSDRLARQALIVSAIVGAVLFASTAVEGVLPLPRALAVLTLRDPARVCSGRP